jgi:hypothetical protein
MPTATPQFLQSLRVTGPCTQSWDRMTGTPIQRHCQICNKDVHNFAAMSPKAIERALADAGRLCARVVNRSDGSLVTADSFERSPLISRASTILLSTAISTGIASAQQTPLNNAKATVTGTVLAPKGEPLASPAHVAFIANQEFVLETVTDSTGKWKAELAPGTYDVIFRNGPLIGERVRSVQLHAGEQSFSNVVEHFAYGQLGAEEKPEETVTLGEMLATYRYPISYFFKHPLRYLKHLPYNFS